MERSSRHIAAARGNYFTLDGIPVKGNFMRQYKNRLKSTECLKSNLLKQKVVPTRLPH